MSIIYLSYVGSSSAWEEPSPDLLPEPPIQERSYKRRALDTGDTSHTLLPRFTSFSQGLIKVISPIMPPIMLTLSVKDYWLFLKGCAPYFSRWTSLFHSPTKLSLWAFQTAGSLAIAPKPWSYPKGAWESSKESWQSCFCQVETASAHHPLDIGVNMRTSFYWPHQSVRCLLTQMKEEWAFPPLLENGTIFALICIITDPERIHVEGHS